MSIDVSSITKTDHVYKFVLTSGIKMQGFYKSKDAKRIELYNDVMKEKVFVNIDQIASFVDDGTRDYTMIEDPNKLRQ